MVGRMVEDHEVTARGRLGRCPTCEAVIPHDRLLASYEAPGEWPRLLAECPACTVVVAPV